MTVEVVRFDTPQALAVDVAERLAELLADTQAGGSGPPIVSSIVLTGGTIAGRIHAAVRVARGATLVDWASVDVWFGDERYVERDSADRNAGQARSLLLDHLPGAGPRVHEMPWADGVFGADLDAAAAAHAAEVDAFLGPDGRFDLLMLGIGPDGHCASLFPGRPEVTSVETVLAVRDSPKPPPLRLSMGMPVLDRAQQVWFVAAGSDKAEAVAATLNQTDPVITPACGPRGHRRTVLFVDQDAAALLDP